MRKEKLAFHVVAIGSTGILDTKFRKLSHMGDTMQLKLIRGFSVHLLGLLVLCMSTRQAQAFWVHQPDYRTVQEVIVEETIGSSDASGTVRIPVRMEKFDKTLALQHQKTLEALERNIVLSVNEEPLERVVQLLKERLGLDIHADWISLAQIGVEKDYPITLELQKPVPGKLVLDLIAQSASQLSELDPVNFSIRGPLLNLSTVRENRIYSTVERVYDIAVLNPISEDKLYKRFFNHGVSIEELLDLIRMTAGNQEDWEEYGGEISQLQYADRSLVVRATPEVHHEIKSLLDMVYLNRERGTKCHVQVLWIKADRFEQLNLRFEDSGTIISEEQLKAIEELKQIQHQITAGELTKLSVSPNDRPLLRFGQAHRYLEDVVHRPQAEAGSRHELQYGWAFHGGEVQLAGEVHTNDTILISAKTSISSLRILMPTGKQAYERHPYKEMKKSVPIFDRNSLAARYKVKIDQTLAITNDMTLDTLREKDGPWRLLVLIKPEVTGTAPKFDIGNGLTPDP